MLVVMTTLRANSELAYMIIYSHTGMHMFYFSSSPYLRRNLTIKTVYR